MLPLVSYAALFLLQRFAFAFHLLLQHGDDNTENEHQQTEHILRGPRLREYQERQQNGQNLANGGH